MDDVRALRAWLERDEPLEGLLSAGELRIEERTSTDGPKGRLGPDIELVLQLLGHAATVVALTEYTNRAVKTWKNNRRRLQGGEPDSEIRPLGSDGE
ncbi:hypothetical protein [Streptomyces violaceus]|uniref:Uncharacterized protein n=1 Tax=Streptomyces violaceus TaxID=1936 RepID=A0ABY9U9L7_STRVL|nr:hypothetical protein [Streptomyces janthinus]WND19561.1 hypothetical protein RI060_20375 [Streptomyces janthinus]